MLDTNNNWQLFGYDFSQVGRRWSAAWRDLLWSEDSPLRGRFDEVVRLHEKPAVHYRHCNREVPSCPTADCDAVLLPEALFLSRLLRLPRAAEENLDAVMAMEIAANSPFPEDDTSAGWRVVSRAPDTLELELVIASLSATMAYLGREYDSHDAQAQEVWAGADGHYVMLQGFGEDKRGQRYRRRLRRTGLMVAGIALLVAAMAAVATGAKYLELQRMEAMYTAVQQQAGGAVEMRNALVTANETITAVDGLVRSYPNPHEEIVRLTEMLDDTTYISQFSMQGNEITIRGLATDAAAVMQLFTGQEAYASVTAEDAFRAYSGGLEEFRFKITLAAGASQ